MPSTGSEVSNAIVKTISPDEDALFIRAYTRYAANYAGQNSAHNGIRVSANYSGPGNIPDGTDFMLVELQSVNYGEGEPGKLHVYVYHPEQNDNYGENWYPSGRTTNGDGPDGGFGTNFVVRSEIIPTRGEWLCHELMVKLNTPGLRDGRVAMWQDGTIVADWQNIRFRDSTSVKLDEVQFENGGQSSSQINDKWYDQVVIATSYIGPMAAASGDLSLSIENGSLALSGQTVTLAVDGEGNTIVADSASQTDVAAAISAASAGDTVVVPAGSATWTNLSITKAVWLQGSGQGVTNITLSNCSATKQAAGRIIISDFSFSKSGGGNGSKAWTFSGSWPTAEPIVFERNAVSISGSGFISINTPGGVVIANCGFVGGWDDSFIQPKQPTDTASWTTNSTYGADDSDGKINTYVEGCDFYGGTNQGIDADDGSRVVYRYNRLTYSSFNSHGWATSGVGVRHYEIYNNDFRYPSFSGSPPSTDVTNQGWHIWLRGGAGVIYSNSFQNITSGWWGNRAEVLFSVRGAEDNRPQGTCANVSYPVPRQIGQGYENGSYSTDKIWLYSNTGTMVTAAGWNWGNPCGLTFSDFWQAGRDYELDNGAKPGYTAFTYPHPLRISTGQAY
jgi:hypothetical protein